MDYVPVWKRFKNILNQYASKIIINDWQAFKKKVMSKMTDIIQGKSSSELARTYISLTVSEFNKILNKNIQNINTGVMDEFFKMMLESISKLKLHERSDIYQSPTPNIFTWFDSDELSDSTDDLDMFNSADNSEKKAPEQEIRQVLSEINQKEGNIGDKPEIIYIDLVSTDSRDVENSTPQVIETKMANSKHVELESSIDCEDSPLIVNSQVKRKDDELSLKIKKFQSIWSILFQKKEIDEIQNKRSKKKTEKKRERDIERAIRYFEKNIKLDTRAEFSEMVTRENFICQKKMIIMIKEFLIKYRK